MPDAQSHVKLMMSLGAGHINLQMVLAGLSWARERQTNRNVLATRACCVHYAARLVVLIDFNPTTRPRKRPVDQAISQAEDERWTAILSFIIRLVKSRTVRWSPSRYHHQSNELFQGWLQSRFPFICQTSQICYRVSSNYATNDLPHPRPDNCVVVH